MSLVNEVLESLEERGRPDAVGSESAIAGLRPARRGSLQRRRRARRRAALGALAALALTPAAWWVRDTAVARAGRSPTPDVAAAPVAVAPAPPAPEPTAAPVAAPAPVAPQPPAPQAEELAVALSAPVARPAIATAPAPALEAAAPEPPAPVRKVQRAPTWDELAERAHRDALELAGRGEIEQAVAGLRRVLELDPGRAAVRENLALILARAGRGEEARAELRAGLALDPSQHALARLLARLLVDDGEVEEALAALEGASPPLERDPSYHAFRAALYQRRGRHDRAAQLYAEVLRRDPGKARWWMGLGISLESEGRVREARRVYQTALAVGGLEASPRRFVGERLRALEPGR